MAYVLSDNRKKPGDIVSAFSRYNEYLGSVKDRFPKSAYQLASSPWYFDFSNHHCPHDSWLESLTINEPSKGIRREIRSVEIAVKLFGAYHDGFITLNYSKVKSYSFNKPAQKTSGHGDWLYDEFRLSESGFVLHEIEWQTGRWLIESADIVFGWIPIEKNSAA